MHATRLKKGTKSKKIKKVLAYKRKTIRLTENLSNKTTNQKRIDGYNIKT